MENDTKQSKKGNFKRLAGARTQEVIRRIRILAHCANRSNYEYTPDDVAKIFSELQAELKQAKSLFGRFEEKQKFEL